MATLLVIHGPNLNLLGKREPALYGKLSLQALNQALEQRAKGHQVDFFQSNAEHEIIATIHTSEHNMLILNAGAFAHTSIALRDALLATKIPFFEVHMTNIYAREKFRQHSYLSDIAIGTITGLGAQGYFAALETALETLTHTKG